MAYGLYEAIEDLGGIALFHTGQTGIGAGVPGGGGIRLKYSNPLYVDDVAADFPGLKIILAHPSFPWQDEALSIATHKPGVYIDLSGWSPKYFPPQLVQYANTLLQDKVLFGSDFPLLTPDRWLADFAALPIKDEVRPKILKQNAARLLGLLPPPAVSAAERRVSAPPAEMIEERRAVRAREPAGVADQVGVVGEVGERGRGHHVGEVLDLRQRVLEVNDREHLGQGRRLGRAQRADPW